MNALSLYRTIWRNFGFTLRPLSTFGLLQTRNALHGLTRGLDHLLHPGFRRLPICRPVFIIGNPRSGTTFLHRFLLHSEQLCAFELWEMLLPAISARRLLGGVVSHLAPLNPARYHSAAAHETSLRDVETDDALAFFQFLDGGFLWSYYEAWEDTFGSPRCRARFTPPPAVQERIFRYQEGCWRRNLYLKRSARILVKSSLLTLQVETLLQRYPDCRLVYLVRDPLETIPSGMSLLTGVLEQAYDIFNRVPVSRLRHYLENLYQASCHLYRVFHELQQRNVIPAERLQIVTYPRLLEALEPTMEQLVGFLGLTPPAAFFERVREQASKQRQRRSEHLYSLEKFGLSEERIRADLRFVYETYDL